MEALLWTAGIIFVVVVIILLLFPKDLLLVLINFFGKAGW